MLNLSLHDARRLALVSQGLHARAPFGRGKEAVYRCIEQLSYVQIDTISVIQRSHHHCLWTRVPSYRSAHLDQLQHERRVFEYWAHAAAYLPMQDYRYCRRYMHAIACGQRHWRSPDRKAMDAVLARVRAEGALKAKDFEHPAQRANDAWGWNWKPAKIALEQLFIQGELMVSHREGFNKVYDLPERLLPSGLDTTLPSDDAFYRYLIERTLRAHGVAMEPEFGYLRKGTRQGIAQMLAGMCEAGEVLALSIAGRPGVWYALPAQLERLAAARVARGVHLLSPFDNAVIQRKRIQQLFDSRYQIECFVPASKREFGYYCLPIVYGTQLVGRLDPKADRQKRQLILRSFHLEQPLKTLDDFIAKLADKLWQVARFNACNEVVWQPAAQDRAGQLLARALAQTA